MISSLLVAYLIGSVPFALLLARWWGTGDLHRIGSGNIGAANVFRSSGRTPGLLVALLDIAKGAAGVAAARSMHASDGVTAAAGFAAILGHIYPVWLRFRGGKGVATSCGVFSVLAPVPMAAAAVGFTITVWLTRYVSLGSVVGSLALPSVALALDSSPAVVLAATAAAVLVVFRHRSNLARVRGGTERRLGVRVRA
jgi:glycerol-3-phosphate acyltransferase PlsY